MVLCALSNSIVCSQDWRGQAIRHCQSSVTQLMKAWSARAWLCDGSAQQTNLLMFILAFANCCSGCVVSWLHNGWANQRKTFVPWKWSYPCVCLQKLVTAIFVVLRFSVFKFQCCVPPCLDLIRVLFGTLSDELSIKCTVAGSTSHFVLGPNNVHSFQIPSECVLTCRLWSDIFCSHSLDFWLMPHWLVVPKST